MKWNIEFVIEPSGREVSMTIEANSQKDAMYQALCSLNLKPSELLHTLHAHIGVPYDDQAKEPNHQGPADA